MPDCQMCWNEWPTLQPVPFPQLSGITVCRNCSRSMKQMIAFVRNHGLDLLPADRDKLLEPVTVEPASEAASMDEPPRSPTAKKPAK